MAICRADDEERDAGGGEIAVSRGAWSLVERDVSSLDRWRGMRRGTGTLGAGATVAYM